MASKGNKFRTDLHIRKICFNIIEQCIQRWAVREMDEIDFSRTPKRLRTCEVLVKSFMFSAKKKSRLFDRRVVFSMERYFIFYIIYYKGSLYTTMAVEILSKSIRLTRFFSTIHFHFECLCVTTQRAFLNCIISVITF